MAFKRNKWIKGIAITIAVIFLLITAFILFLHTRPGKEMVARRVEAYLRKKLQTEVSIDTLNYRLPDWIEIRGLLLKDKNNNELLSGKQVRVNISMLKLLRSDVEIDKITLSGININVYRNQVDSNFSYQFLIDAFTSKTDTSSKKNETHISLSNVSINEFGFSYKDAKDGKYYTGNIGTFVAGIDKMDISNNIFTLKDWYLKNSWVNIIDSSTTAATDNNSTDTSNSPTLSLNGNSLALKDIAFSYRKINEQTVIETKIDSFQLYDPVFDLRQQIFECRSLVLLNSYYKMQVVNNSNEKDSSATISKPWNIRCDTLLLNGNSFAYDNNFFKPTTKGIDNNHLLVKNMMLKAEKSSYRNGELTTTLHQSSLQLNNKLELKNASAFVNLTDSLLQVKNALVGVNNSEIRTEGYFIFPIKPATQSKSDSSPINLQINNSYITLNDIELLAPGTVAKLPVTVTKNDRLNFAGSFSGSMDNILFRNLSFYTSNRQFVFRGSGNVKGATKPDNLQYALAIAEFHADKRLLKPSLQEKLIADSIQLPPTLNLSGGLNGNMNSVTLKNLSIRSDYGTANLNGTVKNFRNTSLLTYNLKLDADQLETGRWIHKDSLLGKLTGNVTVKGKGVDPKKMIADIDLAVKSFRVKNYPYTAIRLKANYDKGAFDTKGSIDDKNLVTQFGLAGKIDEDSLSVKGNMEIVKADLYQLKLSADSFNISTRITIDAPSLKAEDLNTDLFIDSTILLVTGRKIYIDSIRVNGIRRADSTFLTMESPFLIASLNGKYLYDQLPVQVNSYVQKNYFNKSDTVSIIPQQAIFTATLTSHDMVTYLNPDLVLEKPIELTASFDNRETDTAINATLIAAAFHYKSTGAEDILVTVAGKDTSLQFNAAATRLTNAEQSYLKPTVTGSFKDNLWNVAASTKDDDNKDFYAAKASIKIEEEKTVIKLTGDLLLNGDDWKVAPNNSLSILDDGYIFQDFTISRAGQSLSLSNIQPGTVSAIELKVDSFELASIMAFVNKDSLLAAGKMDGNVTIEQPIQEIPEAKGKLTVQELKVKNILIGNVQLSSSVADNQLEFTGDISGENKVTIKGNAGISTGAIDAEIQLQQLNMKSIEAFSGGTIVRASGNVTGNANLNGTIKKPRWNGELNFDNAAFALSGFNSLYQIKQEKIVFNYPTITLDNFRLTDSAGNPLTIDGKLTSLDNGSFDLDLNVRARNFIAINAPRKSGSIIHGIGIMDVNAMIEGNSYRPSIQGNATLENGSNIFYTIPPKNDYQEERNQVVTFIKADTIDNLIKRKEPDSIAPTQFKGFAYNLNLQVKKEATLTVVVDPLTNDELQIQGTAQINAGIDENGEMGLSGVYNLESGYYNMNYQLIKRKFELVKGSTITFSGDPKNAIADITAQYETNASASDLMGNEISGSTASLGAGLTEKIPFIVILTIKGSLLKPVLGFDIKLKEGAAGVNAALAEVIETKLTQIRYDVSAMNKQVFGLLIMNRFIGEKSSDFFGGGGFHADAVARESVSRFLTEAVNQIAEDLIKGVDIDINLKNYEAVDNSINRTDLDVALTKRLLNDRLSISVGKNFTVEGSDPISKTQQTNNEQYIPDVTLIYKLSKDGRYMIRGYRKNQYQAQVDGYFIETGAVFSLSMDYNRFREILQKRKRRNPNRGRKTETVEAPINNNSNNR